jgi:predicted transcriptional regulator
MPSTITIQLDPETEARLEHLASARHQSSNAILCEALAQYLDQAEHPAAKKYPRHPPVGGIITPV